MYLNTIYLGYNSYGVQTAAMQYFDKDVSQLDLAESAVLAGLTNNPSIYDVYNHPEKVKERQETILAQMLDQKMISQEEYEAAVSRGALTTALRGVSAGDQVQPTVTSPMKSSRT